MSDEATIWACGGMIDSSISARVRILPANLASYNMVDMVEHILDCNQRLMLPKRKCLLQMRLAQLSIMAIGPFN